MRFKASSRERPHQTQYTLAVPSEITILAYSFGYNTLTSEAQLCTVVDSTGIFRISMRTIFEPNHGYWHICC